MCLVFNTAELSIYILCITYFNYKCCILYICYKLYMFYITYLFIVVIVRFLAIKIAGVNAGKCPLAVCEISPVVIYGRHCIRPPFISYGAFYGLGYNVYVRMQLVSFPFAL